MQRSTSLAVINKSTFFQLSLNYSARRSEVINLTRCGRHIVEPPLQNKDTVNDMRGAAYRKQRGRFEFVYTTSFTHTRATIECVSYLESPRLVINYLHVFSKEVLRCTVFEVDTATYK